MGNSGWLKALALQKVTAPPEGYSELFPKYYGHFQVRYIVVKVAYKWELIADTKMHNAFPCVLDKGI